MAAKKKIAVNRAPAAKPKPSPKPTTAATAKPAKPPTAPSQFFTPDAPTWFMVDFRAVKPLAGPVTLPAMKAAKSLAHLALIRTGRLSVIPLTPDEWETIIAMGQG